MPEFTPGLAHSAFRSGFAPNYYRYLDANHPDKPSGLAMRPHLFDSLSLHSRSVSLIAVMHVKSEDLADSGTSSSNSVKILSGLSISAGLSGP